MEVGEVRSARKQTIFGDENSEIVFLVLVPCGPGRNGRALLISGRDDTEWSPGSVVPFQEGSAIAKAELVALGPTP